MLLSIIYYVLSIIRFLCFCVFLSCACFPSIFLPPFWFSHLFVLSSIIFFNIFPYWFVTLSLFHYLEEFLHSAFLPLSLPSLSLFRSSSFSLSISLYFMYLFPHYFSLLFCCFFLTSFFHFLTRYLSTTPFNPQFLTFSFLSSVFLFFLLSVVLSQLSSLSNLLVGPIKVYDSAHPHALPLFLLYPLVSW